MRQHIRRIFCVLICLPCGMSPCKGDVITQWTFETSVPFLTDSSTITGILAETGIGIASGFHASPLTDWTNPAGHNSAESFAANSWSINDYFEFSTATTGFENITLSWSQLGTATAPANFLLAYSVNGGTFVDFSPYVITTSFQTFGADFSSIQDLNNAASVDFRLIATSNESVGGGTVATTGNVRVDTVTMSGAAVPEPSSFALLAGGLAALLARHRSRRCQLPTANCQLPTANCQLTWRPTARSLRRPVR